LSPEQKAACDKDFQTHLDRRTRPIEVRDGETREDAVLRAKHEYCDARQEHTAHHRQLAKTMLASKMNCLNDKYPRDSFSLLNPDVAKEFMATAFYHHSAASRGLKSFDKDRYAPRSIRRAKHRGNALQKRQRKRPGRTLDQIGDQSCDRSHPASLLCRATEESLCHTYGTLQLAHAAYVRPDNA
jgi:hypothetical protein